MSQRNHAKNCWQRKISIANKRKLPLWFVLALPSCRYTIVIVASVDDYIGLAEQWESAHFEMLSSRIFRFSAIGVALYDTSGDNILSSKFIIKNR